MNIIKAYKLYKKINKAYKASKKLLDNKQGLAEETKECIADIRNDVQRLVKLLPDYKEVYLDLEVIINNAF